MYPIVSNGQGGSLFLKNAIIWTGSRRNSNVMRFICRCCGASYEKAPRSNPNVCSGCEQLLEDDSPETAVTSLEKEEQKQKKAAAEPAHKPAPKRHSVTGSKR